MPKIALLLEAGHDVVVLDDLSAGYRPSLPLYGQDYPTRDGTFVRDHLYVGDLARAHLLALEAATPGRHDVYNLGTGSGYSNGEVVQVAREVTGHRIPVDAKPRRRGDPDTADRDQCPSQGRAGTGSAAPPRGPT